MKRNKLVGLLSSLFLLAGGMHAQNNTLDYRPPVDDNKKTTGVCPSNPCSFISEGTFEGIPCASYPDPYMNCWKTLAGSPDIITRTCANTGIQVSYNTYNNMAHTYDAASSDSYSGAGTGNDAFLGLYGGRYGSGYYQEAIQVNLGNSLLPGQNYVISFWGKVNKNYAGIGAATNIPANLIFHGLPNIVTQLGFYNSPLPTLVTTAVPLGNTMTVPNDDAWHYFQQVFTFNGTSNYNAMAITYNTFDASYASMTHFDAYVYMDDITVNAVGGISLIGNPPPLCINQTIPDLNVFVSIPGGVFSGPGVTYTGGYYVFDPTGLSFGNHTVNYTYTNSDGCTYHQALTVTIVNANISVTLANQSVCASNTCTTLTPSASGTGPFTYSWNVNHGAISQSVNVCPSGTTTYLVHVTNSTGCVATGSAVVTVVPNPVITVSNTSLCLGGSTTLIASGANNYVWTPATNLSCTTCYNPVANPTTYSYYSVTGSVGTCSSTTQVTVAVNPLPSAFAVNSTTVCAGNNTTLSAVVLPTGPASGRNDGQNNEVSSSGVTYTWAPATGLNSTTGSSVVAHPSITTTYTITATNSYGCTYTTTATVTVVSQPITSICPTQTICLGESATLTASGAGVITWSPATTLNTASGNVVIATPNVNTIYSASSSNASCAISLSTSVIVKPKPEIRYSTSGVNAQVNGFYSSINGSSYVWNASTALYPSLSFNGQGSNTISNVAWQSPCSPADLLETVSLNLDGCTAYLFMPTGVCHPATPFGISGPTLVTPGSTQTYIIQNGTHALLAGLTWVIDGGVIIGGQGTGTATVKWGNGYRGKIAFYAGNTSIGGQVGGLDVVICASTPPVNNFTSSMITVCSTAVSTVLNAGNAGSTYVWSTGATGQTISVLVNTTGNEDYYYVTVTNSNGCKSTFMEAVYTNLGCRTASEEVFETQEVETSVYPNPNNGNFVIETNTSEKQTLQLFDVTGKLILTQILSGKTTIDASTLPEGLYHINITGSKGMVNKRVVIVR